MHVYNTLIKPVNNALHLTIDSKENRSVEMSYKKKYSANDFALAILRELNLSTKHRERFSSIIKLCVRFEVVGIEWKQNIVVYNIEQNHTI